MDVSEAEATIECRSCHQEMPVDADHCTHCGTRVISRVEAAGLAALGGVLAIGTGLVGLWPVAVIGVLALLFGVLLYRNRSRKLQQARQG